jgi:hypothetical protein
LRYFSRNHGTVAAAAAAEVDLAFVVVMKNKKSTGVSCVVIALR